MAFNAPCAHGQAARAHDRSLPGIWLASFTLAIERLSITNSGCGQYWLFKDLISAFSAKALRLHIYHSRYPCQSQFSAHVQSIYLTRRLCQVTYIDVFTASENRRNFQTDNAKSLAEPESRPLLRLNPDLRFHDRLAVLPFSHETLLDRVAQGERAVLVKKGGICQRVQPLP
jgi:hypothetical protein